MTVVPRQSAPSQPATATATQSGAGPTDAALVLAARAGESWAREALFRRHARLALGLAYRILPYDLEADDLVQDSFLYAFERLDRLSNPQAFQSWLSSIVVRTAGKRLRRRRPKRDGSVWCFGDNNFGQLGQGTLQPSSVPLPVSLPGPVRQLSSEANTACVVLEDGRLYCWGRNWEGNIGLDDQHPGVDQPLPTRSGLDEDWALTGTGDGHTCGVRGAGLLYCWGRNSAANLGLGQTVEPQRRVATRVGADDDWRDVVSGQDASCGIRGEGLLFCWGGNSYATLGLGDRETRAVPTEVGPPGGVAGWSRVSLDTFHACGVDASANLYCWGRNLEGQLGLADNDDRLAPAQVDLGQNLREGAGLQQVAVGRFSSCAATTDAHILCVGENGAGQLGVGDTARRNAFTEVSFP